MDRKVSVASGGRGEAYLCFASADARLPKNSAESKSAARFAPGADARAKQESLADRASKEVVSHLAQPVPKRLLVLLS